MIDTNVIIDYLADRAPFADNAGKLIELCVCEKVNGAITASAATDIYYIMRKIAGRDRALEGIKSLFDTLDVVDVGKNDLLRAMDMDMPDFEDALAAVCAKRAKAEYIVTRNAKDFSNASVEPITPKDFLKRFFPD